MGRDQVAKIAIGLCLCFWPVVLTKRIRRVVKISTRFETTRDRSIVYFAVASQLHSGKVHFRGGFEYTLVFFFAWLLFCHFAKSVLVLVKRFIRRLSVECVRLCLCAYIYITDIFR